MKRLTYLNAVLTVIAFCLVMITLAVTGLLPSASAKEAKDAKGVPGGGQRYVSVPLNPDGSINVHIDGAPLAVDITRIGGGQLLRNELPVNLSRIDGEGIGYKTVPVNIKEADGRAIRNYPLPVVLVK